MHHTPTGQRTEHTARIRVLVVDDQGLTRRGILSVLRPERDIQVLDEAADGQEALKKAVALQPDLVLMDIVMAGGDGITATRAIKQQCPRTHVLILTYSPDPELFRKAAEAGAVGYVLKDITAENLVKAIRAVYNGNGMLSPQVAKQMMEQFYSSRHGGAMAGRKIHNLTEREVDVLTGLVAGLSDKEIAARLFLSEATVKTHLRTIYRRLKLRNRAQAAAYAVEIGLLNSVQSKLNGNGHG